MKHVFLTLLFLICFCSQVGADTHYVADDGTDSGTCTVGSPCLTIAYTMGQATAGDTISLAMDDTFAEAVVITKALTFTNTAGGTNNPIVTGGESISTWGASGSNYTATCASTIYQLWKDDAGTVTWVHLAHEPDDSYLTADSNSDGTRFEVIDATPPDDTATGANLVVWANDWSWLKYTVVSYSGGVYSLSG